MELSKSAGDKRERILKIICCPACHGDLNHATKSCGACGRSFSVAEHQFRFNGVSEPEAPAKSDWLNGMKEQVKVRFPWVYPFAMAALSPVYSRFSTKRWLRERQPGKTVVNIGSGASTLAEGIINIDLGTYASVDLVGDLLTLPLKTESIDILVNLAVLEHVVEPTKAVAEFLRVLKPGGTVLCFIPFIQGFHASPFDFQRYTHEGMKYLFRDFEIERVVSIGSTSALVWVLQEWLATLLSLGWRPLYQVIYPMTWILSPLKFLDLLFDSLPTAINISTGNYVVAVKRRKS